MKFIRLLVLALLCCLLFTGPVLADEMVVNAEVLAGGASASSITIVPSEAMEPSVDNLFSMSVGSSGPGASGEQTGEAVQQWTQSDVTSIRYAVEENFSQGVYHGSYLDDDGKKVASDASDRCADGQCAQPWLMAVRVRRGGVYAVAFRTGMRQKPNNGKETAANAAASFVYGPQKRFSNTFACGFELMRIGNHSSVASDGKSL